MSNPFNFYKPKTLFQWLIFLSATCIGLSSPMGTKNFFRELNKYLDEKLKNKLEPFSRKELSNAIYYLKNRKLINIEEKNGKITIYLTEKGKKRKLQYDIKNIEILKPKIWDKNWRFLMFDIPENKKIAREILRKKIKELGFVQFQKSVWIYPYPCENEIDFITEYFSVSSHLILLTVKVKNDQPLRAYFNL